DLFGAEAGSVVGAGVAEHLAADDDGGDHGDRGTVVLAGAGKPGVVGCAKATVTGGADPDGEVAGGPVAPDAHLADLGVGVRGLDIGVIAGYDGHVVDVAEDGEALDGDVGGGRGAGLAACADDDRVAGVADEAAPDGDGADVVAYADSAAALWSSGNHR